MISVDLMLCTVQEERKFVPNFLPTISKIFCKTAFKKTIKYILLLIVTLEQIKRL